MKLHERRRRSISLNFRNIPLLLSYQHFETRHVLPRLWCILALRIVHTRSPRRNCIADYNINIVSHIYIRQSERLRIENRYLVYSVSAVALSSSPSHFAVATAVVLFIVFFVIFVIVVVVVVVASVSRRLYLATRRGTRARKSRQVR